MKPYFSILVPVCNQEGKMNACIESIKAQTFNDLEVIMVDDGSKDGSYQEMLGIAKEDNRFKVIKHETNSSLLAARYTGMNNSNGKYVLFLDSDDYLEADTLESLKNMLDNKPVDVIRFGFQFEPSKKPVLPVESDDPLKGYMLGDFAPAIWKNCYSETVIKKLIESSEPFYCNMGEDVCLAGLLFACAESFDKIDRVFHHYEIGNGMSSTKTNLSMEKFHRDLRSIEESAKHLSDYIAEHKPEYSEYAKVAIRTMFRTVMMQNIVFDTDYTKAVRVLNEFDNEQYHELYEYGCNVILPRKILHDADSNLELPPLDITK